MIVEEERVKEYGRLVGRGLSSVGDCGKCHKFDRWWRGWCVLDLGKPVDLRYVSTS